MGYYSDVKLALPTSIYQKMCSKAKTHQDSNEIMRLLSGAEVSLIKEYDTVILYWKSYKWSDIYPEVTFIMNFTNELDDDDYNMIIVGEKVDDIEVRGCMDEPYLYVVRKIASTDDDKAIPVKPFTLKPISSKNVE